MHKEQRSGRKQYQNDKRQLYQNGKMVVISPFALLIFYNLLYVIFRVCMGGVIRHVVLLFHFFLH